MAAVAAEVKAVMAVAWEVMAGMAAVRAGTAVVPAVVDPERAAAGAASVAVVQEKAAPAVAQPQRTASRGLLPASLASRRAATSEPCRLQASSVRDAATDAPRGERPQGVRDGTWKKNFPEFIPQLEQ